MNHENLQWRRWCRAPPLPPRPASPRPVACVLDNDAWSSLVKAHGCLPQPAAENISSCCVSSGRLQGAPWSFPGKCLTGANHPLCSCISVPLRWVVSSNSVHYSHRAPHDWMFELGTNLLPILFVLSSCAAGSYTEDAGAPGQAWKPAHDGTRSVDNQLKSARIPQMMHKEKGSCFAMQQPLQTTLYATRSVHVHVHHCNCCMPVVQQCAVGEPSISGNRCRLMRCDARQGPDTR